MIGVLALQGAWAAHLRALARAGLEGRCVRRPSGLAGLGGLILPGGESTVMLLGLERAGLVAPLRAFAAAGRPVLATCAGLILAAAWVRGPRQRALGLVDVDALRNGWGTQRDSFLDGGRLFIRAPRITRAGPGVEVLGRVRGEPALVRQGAVFAATYHPELRSDDTLHREVFA